MPLRCWPFLAVLQVVAACDTGSKGSSPSPGAAPSPVAPTSSGAEPSAATGEGSAAPQQTADAWFLLTRDGEEVGVVQVAAGKPLDVDVIAEGESATLLQEAVRKIGKGALPLDMHLPAAPGERGPYGSRSIRPGDALYIHAAKDAFSRSGYEVGTVPSFEDAAPPKAIIRIELARDGEKAGRVDFGKDPPALEVLAKDRGAQLFLQSFWATITKPQVLRVRYLSKSGGRHTLVRRDAKKGSADYPHAVRAALISKYRYDVTVVP